MKGQVKLKTAGLGLAALTLIAASSAHAQTIYLSCHETGSPDRNVTVDLTNGTIDNLPAQINATSFDWNKNLPSLNDPRTTAVIYYHIDRTTGAYSSHVFYSYNGRPNGGFQGYGSCALSAAPVTKY